MSLVIGQQFNERTRIISNSTNLCLSSKQPIRCNHWFSNVFAIFDGHHILYLIVHQGPRSYHLWSLVYNQLTIFFSHCSQFSTISLILYLALKLIQRLLVPIRNIPNQTKTQNFPQLSSVSCSVSTRLTEHCRSATQLTLG